MLCQLTDHKCPDAAALAGTVPSGTGPLVRWVLLRNALLCCRLTAEDQFAMSDRSTYSYDQGADTFGLLRRPTGA